MKVKEFIEGVIKSNKKHQYGYGLEALRLWAARHDSYLGDRLVREHEVGKELENSLSLRKTFWNILGILPQSKIEECAAKSYISIFMLDLIDSYIVSMDNLYKHLKITEAYALTLDFFQNIIDEIYIPAVRNRIISFPNNPQN